MEGFNRFELNI